MLPQPHQRETLAALPAERVAGNLRLTLNQLRKSFPPFLDITRQTIALRQNAACWSDVQALERRAGLAIAGSGNIGRGINFDPASSLWRIGIVLPRILPGSGEEQQNLEV